MSGFKFDSETVQPSVAGIVRSKPSLGVDIKGAFSSFNDAMSKTQESINNDVYDPSKNFSKSDVSDLFLNFAAINGLDFRKVYPYSFSISEDSPDSGENSTIKEIFLPLPPNSFTMDIPSATQLTVTLGGIVEESNGAPLRTINISGSTGIVNKFTSIYNDKLQSSQSGGNGFLQKAADYAIRYGGLNNTVNAIQNVQEAAQNAIQRVERSLGFSNSVNFYPLNEKEDKLEKITGFYWFHSLLRFFEYYLHIKKTEDGKNIRLGFNVYKDKQFFYVTLNNFRWQKIPGSIEYNYSISLTAWKKNQNGPDKGVQALNIGSTPVSRSFNLFDTIRQAIAGLRQTALSLQDVFYALDQDVYENFFSPLNEINLFVKDLQGIGSACGDFLDQFSNGSFSNAVSNAIKNDENLYTTVVQNATKNNYVFGSSDSGGSALIDSDKKTSQSKKTKKSILPNDMVKNPYKYWQVYDQISVDSLELDQKSGNAINSKLESIRSFGVNDIIKKKKKFESLSKTFSEIATKDKRLNLKDIQMSSVLNELILQCDVLINYLKNQPKNTSNDYYSYYIDYAVSNGLNLQLARSKFFVPFPVGSTLEALSLAYLGDSGRWMEIAALNGLKSPYIDEEGFSVLLKSNGSQSTILLSTRENFYIGQVITIKSDAVTPKKIKIKDITEFSKTEFLFSLEGELDLSEFKTIDNASVHAYLPNTVNSDMLIAIPSQAEPVNQDQVNLGPGLDQLDSVAQLSKIDFLLTPEGDLSILPSGDIKKATGYTNLVQAAKIKLFTAQGSMLHRPYFGNPLQSGISIANFSAKEYLTRLNTLFGQDGRFSGILLSNINVRGPSADVNLLIGTNSTGVNLPITTTVPVVKL
jgi:hypothetical protein